VTDYFTKWIEAIPTRQATNLVIIQFLENNILSHFGCPNKLITDNATAFKSKNMIDFCNNIKLPWGTLLHIIHKVMDWWNLQTNHWLTSSKSCWKQTKRAGIRNWLMHYGRID